MTTQEMERLTVEARARHLELDKQALELWHSAVTESEKARYKEVAAQCNEALDEWLTLEAQLFERWDQDALNPQEAK